jgi:hypothetical protein
VDAVVAAKLRQFRIDLRINQSALSIAAFELSIFNNKGAPPK